MNLEPMLNHLWELSHDAKQYSDLVNLCQKEAINNLPQRIVFNTKEILRHLCSECLVATYHELRTEGKLNRRTREERVQLLDREYLQNKGFVQYFLVFIIPRAENYCLMDSQFINLTEMFMER